MTTKDHCLSFKDKHEFVVGNTSKNEQHNNLNLNQSLQSLSLGTVQSKTITNNKKNSQIYDVVDDNCKKGFNSWKFKSDNSKLSNYVQFNHDKNKFKQKNRFNNNSSSTLSLHIEAYENSAEPDGDNVSVERNKGSNMKDKSKAKTAFIGSPSVIQNPFEFPRQQENSSNEAEMMQFRASQKLVNQNATAPPAQGMEFMDVITIDDGSDDEMQSSQASSNGEPNNYFASGGATIKITNERPLDLSQFLNFSTTAPKEITPPPQQQQRQTRKPSTMEAIYNSSMTINAPFMSRASFIQRNTSTIKNDISSNNSNGIRNGSSSSNNVISINGVRNGNYNSNGYPKPLNTSILTDGNNRKRSLEPARQQQPPAPIYDKRQKLSAQGKRDIHGSINYIVSEPNHGFTTQDGEEFPGQFRCTFLNCNKVLSNNVSFMYHLWAHVGFFQRREFSSDYDTMTDEKFTRMCSVCLTVFDTAFEKTRHYLEVHRGVFATYRLCHICETVDHDGKHVSEIKHRQNELPYECRRCKFRSSSRMALIDHYSKIHIGTTLLMCPFCPYTTQISVSEKMKPVVLAKNYVAHVTEHGRIIAKKCSMCSYKFIDDSHFEKHIKCHQIEVHKWPVQFKSFKTLKEEALKTKPRHEQLTLLKCVECDTLFPKAEDHFDKLRKCDRCSFETTCIKSYWQHMFLSDCDPENKERFTLAVTKDANWVPPKCSFKIRKNLEVTKSKDFIQNFRMFRDFSYDRKPSILPESQEKTEIDLIKERREKLRNMTTARRTNDIPSYILDGIAESLFAEEKEDTETMAFIKGIRVPITPLCEEFLAEKKRKEEEEGGDVKMLEDSSEIDNSATEAAAAPSMVGDTVAVEVDEVVSRMEEEKVVEQIVTVEEQEVIGEEKVETVEEEKEVVEQNVTIEDEEMDQQPSKSPSPTPTSAAAILA